MMHQISATAVRTLIGPISGTLLLTGTCALLIATHALIAVVAFLTFAVAHGLLAIRVGLPLSASSPAFRAHAAANQLSQ